ncbi:MAG: hypothetical protein ING75_01775 [Rhodocyclaceae bacterium]|nr:hypothetical protein [Rhodocyclaceae bacterium]
MPPHRAGDIRAHRRLSATKVQLIGLGPANPIGEFHPRMSALRLTEIRLDFRVREVVRRSSAERNYISSCTPYVASRMANGVMTSLRSPAWTVRRDSINASDDLGSLLLR